MNAPTRRPTVTHGPVTVTGTDSLHQFRLPADLYPVLQRDDLRDLELIDEQGYSVPLAILPESTVAPLAATTGADAGGPPECAGFGRRRALSIRAHPHSRRGADPANRCVADPRLADHLRAQS
ncbi:MAG: DUF3999 family protein [Ahniella sp.]|nr:DUF3999 family protein [Ahniella sp.]